jgi:SPP1 family predicted phage head-tail adaptor
MMRAGKMDRQFTIDRASETIDDAGTPVQTWATFAAMWGELIENSTADSPQAEGSRTTASLTLKTRYIAGVTLEDRLTYQGTQHRLTDLQEIGRREGLLIKAAKVS